jgi:predicted DNA-binding protein (MmcQ/YjbR family)
VTTVKAAKTRLLKYALAKADATLDHPWGENVAKVRGKVFVFFGLEEPDAAYADYVMGVKLTTALLYAKSLPFVEAMGYGLGKSGWISVKKPKGPLPTEMFEEWIDESYANVAPKRKVAAVSSAAPKGRARPVARRAPARRTPSRSSGR